MSASAFRWPAPIHIIRYPLYGKFQIFLHLPQNGFPSSGIEIQPRSDNLFTHVRYISKLMGESVITHCAMEIGHAKNGILFGLVHLKTMHRINDNMRVS